MPSPESKPNSALLERLGVLFQDPTFQWLLANPVEARRLRVLSEAAEAPTLSDSERLRLLGEANGLAWMTKNLEAAARTFAGEQPQEEHPPHSSWDVMPTDSDYESPRKD